MNELELFDRIDKIKDSMHSLTLEVRKNNGIKERVEKNAEAISHLTGTIQLCSNIIQDHLGDHRTANAKKNIGFGQVFTIITTVIALGALLIAILK